MFVALILGFVALVASVIGLAIPYWLYVNVAGVRGYEGLWEACTKAGHASGCISYGDSVTSAMKATRALTLLGVFLMGFALLCAILKLTVMKHRTVLPTLSGLLFLVAGVFTIIGDLVYATKVREQLDPTKTFDLYAGFGLSIAGGGIAILAGIFFFVVARRTGSYDQI